MTTLTYDPLGDGKSQLELLHVSPKLENLDAFICNVARISFANDKSSPSPTDRGLIRYLLRKRHTSPFEMVEFHFIVKCPIFVARQWIRHRTASVNEESGRYTIYRPEFYIPPTNEDIKLQSKDNKQGRDEESVSQELAQEYRDYLRELYSKVHEKYLYFVEQGMAKEIARNMLPLAQYTRFIWKMDLHNLLNFIRLRTAPDAMLEIRKYALAIRDSLKPLLPLTMEAYEDFQQESLTLTRLELESIKEAEQEECQTPTLSSKATLREVNEWEKKKERLGLKPAAPKRIEVKKAPEDEETIIKTIELLEKQD